MNYQSTRNKDIQATSAQAILKGLAPDGGLYVLPDIKSLNFDWRKALDKDYYGMAASILSALLPDFSESEALALSHAAYDGKFSSPALTPLSLVGEDAVLELFHGPTSAFKDMALCLLPQLMQASAKKLGDTEDVLILTATSGDTGKAAMEGFKDVPGVRIIVFYPQSGVSPVQEAQMYTQEGENVKVCSVRGNFDDAQTGVKRIFASQSGKLRLSSANSINVGRLVPQVVYYFSAYADMVKQGKIAPGDKLDYVVPTGNFGDILAGCIAGELGLPVGRLVCASNVNNVLTDFFSTGCYDRRRPFHKSLSPSMDILVSSNLERLLYMLSGDSQLVASLMSSLDKNSYYQLPEALLKKAQAKFFAGCCDDENTLKTIASVWQQHHYLMDTHTAVAWNVAQQYKEQNPQHNPVVVLSTASPYKFPAAVAQALNIENTGDDFALMDAIQATTGVPMPQNLAGLLSRPRRHYDNSAVEQMESYVCRKAAEKDWNSVTVRVPATTANLGPGFDTLGCALELYNTLRFTPAESLSFTGCELEYQNADNLAWQAFSAVYAHMGKAAPAVAIDIQADIPVCRGLGSSAALIAAGALAANALGRFNLSAQQLLSIVTPIEGHPDNLAPALLGGLTASMTVEGSVYSVRYKVHPELRFVLMSPDFPLSTHAARSVLPETVPYKDAVSQLSLLALLPKALEQGDTELIAHCLKDKLHQPYRFPLIAESDKLRQLAKELGCEAFCISGAGPSLLCITRDETLAEKLRASSASLEHKWHIQTLPLSTQGASLI